MYQTCRLHHTHSQYLTRQPKPTLGCVPLSRRAQRHKHASTTQFGITTKTSVRDLKLLLLLASLRPQGSVRAGIVTAREVLMTHRVQAQNPSVGTPMPQPLNAACLSPET